MSQSWKAAVSLVTVFPSKMCVCLDSVQYPGKYNTSLGPKPFISGSRSNKRCTVLFSCNHGLTVDWVIGIPEVQTLVADSTIRQGKLCFEGGQYTYNLALASARVSYLNLTRVSLHGPSWKT